MPTTLTAAMLLAAMCPLVACAGSSFSSGTQSCADGGCGGVEAGAASGGRAGGGALSSGGSSAGGSATGDSGSGTGGAALGDAGSGGAGGSIDQADSGAGGATTPDGGTNGFPRTPVLDTFSRTEVGLSWIGATDTFAIEANELVCQECVSPLLWATPFGSNQEAFAKLTRFEGEATEINIVLKAQDSTDCDMIEILYDPAQKEARVEHCFEGQWQQSAGTPVSLEPGDVFGGRAHADGRVEIFVNGTLVASHDVSDYPFDGGRIGTNGLPPAGGFNAIDDFGGGDF